MGLKNVFRRGSTAAPVEKRGQVVEAESGDALIEMISGGVSESVTPAEAIGLTPVWAAVNFLSAAMADLPLEVYQKTTRKGADRKLKAPICDVLSEAVNETTTSVDWREVFFSEVFQDGRGYTYIERDDAGEPVNLFHLEEARTTPRRDAQGRVFYDYRRLDGRQITYSAGDVIDLAFLRKPDMVNHYRPLQTCRAALRQDLNAQKYANTVFGKNGVPPYTLKGAFQGAKAAAAAAADVLKVARRTAEEGKAIMPLPSGVELQRLGTDPDKMQLTDARRFGVEQAARIYQLPPMFLQDLSKGTFANTEQQDLHLVKHTLRRWVKKFEAELTLKLFGRGSKRYVKMNLDGLLRGDFKARIEGLAKAVQNAIMTPNEARALEDREPMPGGDSLMIQGATVPIELAGNLGGKAPPDPDPEPPKPTDSEGDPDE